jgi:hypothetical protein
MSAASLPRLPISAVTPVARVSAWDWFWSLLFMAHFFLPYIPGTRIRFEILTLLIGLAAPFTRMKSTARDLELYWLAAACGGWSLLRIAAAPSPAGSSVSAIQWINLNFAVLAIGLALMMRHWLASRRLQLVWYLLWIGIVNNLIAASQCWLPDAPWQSFVYQYYGGTISDDYDVLLMQNSNVAMSNAEFLAKMGGRYTGILATSHMLSVVNVWLVGLSYAMLQDRQTSSWQKQVSVVSLGLALLGGMLSGGKMFYLGVGLALGCLMVVRRQFGIVIWCCLLGMVVVLVAPFFVEEDSEIHRLLTGRFDEVLATRYSSDGYLAETMDRLWNDRSLQWWGVGANLGNLIVADSLFLLPLCTGGLPLLVLYLTPLGMLVLNLMRRLPRHDPYIDVLLCVHVSFLISGIGVPIYQMGRLAPMFWMITLAFLFGVSTRAASAAGGGPSGTPSATGTAAVRGPGRPRSLAQTEARTDGPRVGQSTRRSEGSTLAVPSDSRETSFTIDAAGTSPAEVMSAASSTSTTFGTQQAPLALPRPRPLKP